MKIQNLLELLALHGGKIVSTAQLSVEDINQAKASGRMFVDENSLGYVWEPEWYGGGRLFMIPVTDEEVEWFKKWFPLNVPFPKSLKMPTFEGKMFGNLKYGECVHGENMAQCEECRKYLAENNQY